MPKMIQIVYMSAATREFDEIELTVLLAKARLKNELLNVSGMLVYHDHSFLQVLEGDENVVNDLYEHIRTDSRHSQCEQLLRTFIDRRNFGDWKMGFIDTKLFGPKSLPGYSNFFGTNFSKEKFAANSSLPHKQLLSFREGSWRQKVEFE